MARETRAAWAGRVERWWRSGLTADRFADQEGINARTLAYWKWRLKRTTQVLSRVARLDGLSADVGRIVTALESILQQHRAEDALADAELWLRVPDEGEHRFRACRTVSRPG